MKMVICGKITVEWSPCGCNPEDFKMGWVSADEYISRETKSTKG